jgi:hypothetical protein
VQRTAGAREESLPTSPGPRIPQTQARDPRTGPLANWTPSVIVDLRGSFHSESEHQLLAELSETAAQMPKLLFRAAETDPIPITTVGSRDDHPMRSIGLEQIANMARTWDLNYALPLTSPGVVLRVAIEQSPLKTAGRLATYTRSLALRRIRSAFAAQPEPSYTGPRQRTGRPSRDEPFGSIEMKWRLNRGSGSSRSLMTSGLPMRARRQSEQRYGTDSRPSRGPR